VRTIQPRENEAVESPSVFKFASNGRGRGDEFEPGWGGDDIELCGTIFVGSAKWFWGGDRKTVLLGDE